MTLFNIVPRSLHKSVKMVSTGLVVYLRTFRIREIISRLVVLTSEDPAEIMSLCLKYTTHLNIMNKIYEIEII